MLNQQNELEQVEISIEQAKEAITLMNVLLKLSKNRDFDKIIHKGYFEGEAIRLVMAKSNPVMATPEHQESINKAIDGIGALRQYFAAIISQGRQMENAIKENEAAREEILAEQANASEED